MKILKVRVGELKEFIGSELYRNSNYIPIARLRAESYIQNPHASNSDPVLYLKVLNGEIIAYRSVLVDEFFDGSARQKCIWLSGTWVHSEYRRRGLSTQLLKTVTEDWGHRIAAANFAPAAEKLLLRSGIFEEWRVLEGMRFYHRFCFGHLLPPRYAVFKFAKPALQAADWLLNTLDSMRFKNRWSALSKGDLRVERMNRLSDGDWNFLQKFLKGSGFRRNRSTWEWLLSHPWASSDVSGREEQKRFPFTSWGKDFKWGLFRIKDGNGALKGIAALVFNKGQLKIPYAFFEEGEEDYLKSFVLLQMKELKPLFITVFDKNLISVIAPEKGVYWHKREFRHWFFIHRDWLPQMKNGDSVQLLHGDGETVFT